jgi:hypothetical protein
LLSALSKESDIKLKLVGNTNNGGKGIRPKALPMLPLAISKLFLSDNNGYLLNSRCW